MARAIWKGTLGFGLVNIGVELLTAGRADELDLDLLDRRDHARIGYQKYNKSTGELVDNADIVRGFPVGDDQYVVLSDDDLKAANPKATQSIDIVGFVPEADVPRIFYDRPYYVSPLKGSERAYALLRDALSESAQLALAQIVIHTRQHVAAVYAFESALVVQLLRYAGDLKDPEEAGVKSPAVASKKTAGREVAMAEQLISAMHMDWEPEQFRDTYRDDVLKLVRERAKKGGKATATPATVTSAAKQTKVLDLVAALQKSLGSPSSKKAAAPAKKGKKTASRTSRGRVA
jgi:DNA end-binding protein Ku